MKELLTCCYELMELELRAQHIDQLLTLLCMAERIDLQRRGGIIESRYSDDQPRDDHGRWTSGGGGESSGGGSGGDALADQLNDSSVDYHPVTDAAIDSIPEIAVFDNAELNQAVHTGCVDVLKAVKDAPPGTEATITISLDAKHKSDVQIGKPGSGDIDPIKMDVPYVAIHNHASGETFSMADLMIFHDDTNCKSIVVIGNNSNMYILKKNANFNSTEFFEYCMRKHLGFTSYNSEDDFIQGAGVCGASYYKRTN